MATAYYVIDIVKASDVPKMDVLSANDTYVILKINDENKEIRSLDLTCDASTDPVWNCRRIFNADAAADTLYFELWDDDDLTPDDYIGSCSVALNELSFNKEELRELEVDVNDKYKEKNDGDLNTTLSIRVWKYNYDEESINAKTLIFIRHGESVWNEAQSNKDLLTLVEQVDHPLCESGIKQAIALNTVWKDCVEDKAKLSEYGMNEEDLEQFLNAELILSSPLARAAQTAIVSLNDHETLKTKGVRLLRDLREIKKLGGQDTASKYKSKEIVDHIYETLEEYGKDVDALNVKDLESNCSYDYNDTRSKWWNDMFETKTGFSERLTDAMNYLSFEDEKVIICVGHSLWIKRFFQTYLSQETHDEKFAASQPQHFNDFIHDCHNCEIFDEKEDAEAQDEEELKENFQREKIENCGCFKVDITFGVDAGNSDVAIDIEGLKLLFGSKLEGDEKKVENDDEADEPDDADGSGCCVVL